MRDISCESVDGRRRLSQIQGEPRHHPGIAQRSWRWTLASLLCLKLMAALCKLDEIQLVLYEAPVLGKIFFLTKNRFSTKYQEPNAAI